MLPDEVIMSKIYLIRGTKVILDRDLAELYKVDTKQLKRTVRRNIDRFPDDFMFELSKDELANWRYQFGTSNSAKMGLRFTFSPLPRFPLSPTPLCSKSPPIPLISSYSFLHLIRNAIFEVINICGAKGNRR